MKHVVLYVGHMYKPFWTKKIWPGWQGGSGKVKIGQNIAQNGPRFWLWSPLEAPKWVKDPWNGPKKSSQLSPIDLSPFLDNNNFQYPWQIFISSALIQVLMIFVFLLSWFLCEPISLVLNLWSFVLVSYHGKIGKQNIAIHWLLWIILQL